MPKKDIHPQYFDDAKFVCTTCANEFTCGTTRGEEVRVDICSNCHPFYTGNQKFANNQGRVEQFKNKFAKRDATNAAAKADSEAKKATNAKKEKASK
ncbi:50S ribosomal protein L31 [Mesoplasma lactucae]|uniref:Large ribosomal subunit protein bL31 n=1 Tax=Mesoplasma lactucae ATCC 49193 TaxID=81460 RepID=A0A291ISU5_9MOLU|nr:50S ribosomal protein L31 [Mesoplasma lactucae ATCC 49193]ATZ20466.1 50S ribosomal protein L31 [Mesoplasma lactucae ATCC 49193]MCL8216638.1 50S ribosomal protein L31 [Mesoplasma lactucae ATCC 49193]